jgi:hypothetical protein
MKAVQSLLNVIAKKKPKEVFSARVGNRTVRAVEQEFILEPSSSKRKGDVHLEYASNQKRLLPGDKGLHYISVKTASDKYKLAVRTVQQLCRDRKIISRRQGNGDNSPWLVAEESIKAYCDAQRA